MKKLLNALLAIVFTIFMASYAVQATQSAAKAPHYANELADGGIKAFFHWTADKNPLVSAHRGGPMPGYPENAIETFANAASYGAMIIEMDIARTADGIMVLMHDDQLDRTTTYKGAIVSISYADLLKCNLVDNDGKVTAFKVPRLKDTLLWSKGKVVLNLDIKKGVSYARVVEVVRQTATVDNVVMISYNLRQAQAIHRVGPEFMLSIPLENADKLAKLKASALPIDQVVAWVGTKVGSKDFYDLLHGEGLYVCLGTLGRPDYSIDGQIERAGDDSAYLALTVLGVDIIATDRLKAVTGVLFDPKIIYFTPAQRVQH